MKELQRIKSRLEMYYDAEEKILQGQSYAIGSRSLTRANLKEVQDKIKELETKANAISKRGNTKRPVRSVIPKW